MFHLRWHFCRIWSWCRTQMEAIGRYCFDRSKCKPNIFVISANSLKKKKWWNEFQFELAEQCLKSCSDINGLFLLHVSTGNMAALEKLAIQSYEKGFQNVTFLCYMLSQRIEDALQLLIETNRLPEAAFFARSYLPRLAPQTKSNLLIFAYLLIFACLLIYLLTCLLTCLFICLLTCLFICLLTYLFAYLLTSCLLTCLLAGLLFTFVTLLTFLIFWSQPLFKTFFLRSFNNFCLEKKTKHFSHVSRVVDLWREDLQNVNKKAAESLADPSQYQNLFPEIEWVRWEETAIND